jgi:hypothetical protein
VISRIPVTQFAAYNLYADRLPPRHAPIYRGLLTEVRDRAPAGAPDTVTELVAAPARRWEQRSGSVNLFAFGSFRSEARTIIDLSDFLVPIYLEYGVLPIIRPITNPRWNRLVDSDAPEFLRIRNSGLVTFERGRR